MPKPAHHVILSLVMVCTSTGSQRADSSHAFANPVTLAGHNGRLDVDLVAAPAGYMIEGRRFQGELYNGQYMPPLWRLRDTLTVTLHNQLPEEPNLHFHGLRVRAMRPRRSILNRERKCLNPLKKQRATRFAALPGFAEKFSFPTGGGCKCH